MLKPGRLVFFATKMVKFNSFRLIFENKNNSAIREQQLDQNIITIEIKTKNRDSRGKNLLGCNENICTHFSFYKNRTFFPSRAILKI